MTPANAQDTAVDRLLEAAAKMSGMDRAQLTAVLAMPQPDFDGSTYLDSAVLETWPALPLSARAVAIVSALSRADADEANWDRYEML